LFANKARHEQQQTVFSPALLTCYMLRNGKH